jgi:hypothetical protein
VLQEVSTECRRNMKHPESRDFWHNQWHVIDGARTIEKLALPCLTMRIDVKFLMAKHLHLSRDVLEKTANAEPKIMLGPDNQNLTVARKVFQPTCKGPMMTKTKLGWIVHGVIRNSRTSLDSVAFVNTCCEHDDNLHDLVKPFMTLENF